MQYKEGYGKLGKSVARQFLTCESSFLIAMCRCNNWFHIMGVVCRKKYLVFTTRYLTYLYLECKSLCLAKYVVNWYDIDGDDSSSYWSI